MTRIETTSPEPSREYLTAEIERLTKQIDDLQIQAANASYSNNNDVLSKAIQETEETWYKLKEIRDSYRHLLTPQQIEKINRYSMYDRSSKEWTGPF